MPVLVLNGKADIANQKITRLLDCIPNATSILCEGDHYSAPFQPTFQQAAIDFFENQWKRQSIDFRKWNANCDSLGRNS